MVKESWETRLNKYPEVNMATRLVAKYELTPAIDVESLASKYAIVEEMEFPVEADGITLNLKVSGKKPHIIINGNSPPRRKRFTLAHELGHVIIPWHVGTIIDVLDMRYSHSIYSEAEAEANRFAAELLTPTSWVIKTINRFETIEESFNYIVKKADISPTSAVIKITQCLKPGHIYAQLADDRTVISSGRSQGTLAPAPGYEHVVKIKKQYPSASNIESFSIDGYNYCWWEFDCDADIPKCDDDREWREILDEIVTDLGIEEAEKYKSSLNGCIAYANGTVKGEARKKEALYAACMQRLHSKPVFRDLIEHSVFVNFMLKRIEDLLK